MYKLTCSKCKCKKEFERLTCANTEWHCMSCDTMNAVPRDFIDKSDNVNHPKHYLSHPSGVECIQITKHYNFCIGNVIKYVWRCDHKNGLEDLKKARWYLDQEIKDREDKLNNI